MRYDRRLPYYIVAHLDVRLVPDTESVAAITRASRIFAYIHHLIPYHVADDRSATNARSWMSNDGLDGVDRGGGVP